MAETGRYLYAVCRGVAENELREVRGLRDQPVRLVEHRGLAALVSDVDLDEFGEDGLREHLEDLRWLEEVARTHDAVAFAAATAAPTAPLRLATICLTDAAVRDRLDRWHDPLVSTLDRIAGRHEWSVKAFASPRVATPSPASGSGGESADSGTGGTGGTAPGAGAAYLRRRKEEAAQREHDAQTEQELADQLHAALSAHVAASRRLALQDPRLSGHQGTMILNGAYLVDDAAASELQDAVKALGDAHPSARLEVGGPWPAYSFVALDDA